MGSHLKDLLSYESFVHAVSGACGGFVAMSSFYPLDTARTILQVDDRMKGKSARQVIIEIIEKEGIGGLYNGWFPVISSLWCSNFVYFYSYNFLKLIMFGQLKSSTPSRDLTAASLAGIVNVLTTTPMWVVNTRLKLQSKSRSSAGKTQYRGIIDCFRKIISNEGVMSLWSGTLPSLALVCNPTIQFVVYEALKRRAVEIFGKDGVYGVVLFLIGALSKAIATIITYPIQIIQSRLRGREKSVNSKQTILQCVQEIYRNGGWKGFYRGIDAKLLQTVLMAALMFLTYEKISTAVFTVMSHKK